MATGRVIEMQHGNDRLPPREETRMREDSQESSLDFGYIGPIFAGIALAIMAVLAFQLLS